MQLFNYIIDRGGRVIMKEIEQPIIDWDSALHAYQSAYEHECIISLKLDNIMNLASKLNDHRTYPFLQSFILKQIKAESNANKIIQRLKLLGESVSVGLFTLDSELLIDNK